MSETQVPLLSSAESSGGEADNYYLHHGGGERNSDSSDGPSHQQQQQEAFEESGGSGGSETESDDGMLFPAFGEEIELRTDSILAPEEFQAMQQRFEQASVYLFAGQNNIKFEVHPDTPELLHRYKQANNHWVYIITLCASVLLLSLAAIEAPSVNLPYDTVPINVHIPLELLCMLVFTVDSVLQYRWLGRRQFLKRGRCLIKCFLIVFMTVESLVVFGRSRLHFRAARALRPFFLLDNHYMASVRRVTRQIMQSIWPIIDMIVLLLFFISMFTVIGFYAFSENNDDPYFATLQSSFVSLFVLITTSNYPDVMMPAYSENSLAFLFFFFYLVGGLYFLQNLLLAVVYDTFRNFERAKFRALFLHKRDALRRAYALLKDDLYGGIPFANFRGLMTFRQPRFTPLRVRLMFDDLNESETGAVNLVEFYQFYSTEMLSWERVKPPAGARRRSTKKAVSALQAAAAAFYKFCVTITTGPYFDYIIDCIIVANTIVITYYAAIVTELDADEGKYVNDPNADIAFLSIYWIEVVVKMTALGVTLYFEDGWRRFDFLITILGTIMLALQLHASEFVALRQLRVLRLFKIKARFRQVLGSIVVLVPKLVSFLVALGTVFYAFSIIGIECFAGTITTPCPNCSDQSKDYYSNATSTDRYYLNNFDNIFRSFVTLFELMVVNNWMVIMDGTVSFTNEWARVYFMFFYIIAVILTLNVVVAFILETFLSRISFERATEEVNESPGDDRLKVDGGGDFVVGGSSSGGDGEEPGADLVISEVTMPRELYLKYRQTAKRMLGRGKGSGKTSTAAAGPEPVWEKFKGKRKKMMEDYQVLIFSDEVARWCEEDEVLRTSMLPIVEETPQHMPDGTNLIKGFESSEEGAVAPARGAVSTSVVSEPRGRLDDNSLEEFRLQLPPGAASRLPWALQSQATRIQSYGARRLRADSTRRRTDTGEHVQPQPLDNGVTSAKRTTGGSVADDAGLSVRTSVLAREDENKLLSIMESIDRLPAEARRQLKEQLQTGAL